jgi:hypothetical protein
LVVQRQPKSPPNPVEVAGQALRDFEAWADDEMKRQNVIDQAAVVGLDPKQAASVQAAAKTLTGYIPTMRATAVKADPALASLRTTVTHAAKARSLMQSKDPADHRLAGPERNQSRDALVKAIGQISQITSGRCWGADCRTSSRRCSVTRSTTSSSSSSPDPGASRSTPASR